MRKSTRRLLWTTTIGAGLAAAGWALRGLPAELGADPTGERAERIRRSPQFRDGKFHNTVPASVLPPGGGREMLREFVFGDQQRTPTQPIPLVTPTDIDLAPGSLHVTWYGHSSALVEIEGRRVLFDPVWSERCSPVQFAGPKRLHPVPVPVAALPPLDAIVISHDHYDHLDLGTVRALVAEQSAPFYVPLGVGAHFDRWGVPADRVVELDWDETADVAGVRLTATAARHFSGRRTVASDRSLWASWVVAGESRRAFYTGDSGFFPGYEEIGAAYGPFDVTLIQIGAYGPGWPDIHMTPEEGIAAHLAVGGRLMVPLHWATFVLSIHAWGEPADRAWVEAKARGVTLAVPRPGERVDIDAPPAVDGWWQAIA